MRSTRTLRRLDNNAEFGDNKKIMEMFKILIGDDPAYDGVIIDSLSDYGDVRLITKDQATDSGRSLVMLTFTVDVENERKVKDRRTVQTVTSVRLFKAAAAAIAAAYDDDGFPVTRCPDCFHAGDGHNLGCKQYVAPVAPKDVELEKAIAQFTGWKAAARDGESIADLCQSMGLTKAEYLTIVDGSGPYGLDWLGADLLAELAEHFEGSE